MKFLFLLLRRSPQIIILIILTSLLSGICSASLVTIINKALSRQDASFFTLGWNFAGLILVSIVATIISQILLSFLYRRAVYNLQVNLSRQILKTPLAQLEKIGKSSLLTILTKDITDIGNSLLPVLPFCTDLAIITICLGYLYLLSVPMFIGVLSALIFGIAIYKIILRNSILVLKNARKEFDILQGYFSDLIDGIKELKMHQNRSYYFFEEHLNSQASSIQKLFLKWSILHSLSKTWVQFSLLSILGIILFALPLFFEVNTQILTSYILILLYIRSKLSSVMGGTTALSKAQVAFDNIEKLGLQLSGYVENQSCFESQDIKYDWQRLEFNNISHTYFHEQTEDLFKLGPIKLIFQPGELVFLVGGNGSGKTTLAKLICGLYTSESGTIHLDRELISATNLDWYRQHFSVVFSDFYLFDNLLGLDAYCLDEKAQNFLINLQLDHKVKVTDGYLSTTALSGGQRQRLALLTAYLEDRPFYLFDEWAANQDPSFKEIFYTQFLKELKSQGKTVLVISHDDKYFHLADRILKLNYGHIEGEEPDECIYN